MLEANTIYCGDCAKVMERLDSESVDLVVTSPPYDNLRQYNGYTFDFESIARQITRTLKVGGVLVWVVSDAVIKQSESATSFRQGVFFIDKCGLLLHDSMIYLKTGMSKPSVNRYHQVFEYMLVFAKKVPPKTFNPLMDRKNKFVGVGGRNAVGGKCVRQEYGMRFNVWTYANGKNHTARYDDVAFSHPAPFPEQLAADHIRSWSNAGDLVVDPMCGSGTTLKSAKLLGRNYIGIDISQAYCDLSRQRLISAAAPEDL